MDDQAEYDDSASENECPPPKKLAICFICTRGSPQVGVL